MPSIQVNQQILYFDDTGGDKEALLFLHGFLFDTTMFDSQIELLAPEFRCIRLDTRGFGQTIWDGKEFNLADIVSDCLGLIDYLGLEKVSLIGMSQGAYVALRFAIKYPNRTKALVLMSTRKDILSEEFNANYASLRDNWGKDESNSFLIDGLMTLLIGQKDKFAPYWEQWRAKWEAFDHNHMYHTINALLSKEILTDEQIKSVTVPVLSIHGVDDRGTPVLLANQLYDLFPNGKGKIRVNGAAHAVNMTHAAKINPALLKFLKEELA